MAVKSKKSGLSQKVMKVMMLFTGMQFFTILCSIIKTKLVALWLSADGVGLFGILNTTIDTTATLTDMGLRQSAVRDVAQNSQKPSLLARTAEVVRRWSRLTGAFGAVVLCALAVPLSQWFFASYDRWWMFALVSLSMLLNAITGGEQALLQGSQRLKDLLRATVWGSAAGLILSIPLYRWCGLTGVVWSVIIYSAAGLVAVLYHRLRTPHSSTHPLFHSSTHPPINSSSRLSSREVWNEGKGFMKLGLWMAVAAFVTNMTHMIFLAFLSRKASLAEVGYYQGGVTLVVRYMGLIFTAMSMEFYPRLAANAFSKKRTALFVNHEATVLLTVLIPVIAIFLLARQWIVLLLYRPEFMAMIPFISWAVLSCVFKASSWCMAYVMLARGDGKIYLITEASDACFGLLLCIGAYSYIGLEGVGIAYILWYLLYTVIVGCVFRFRYKMRLRPSVVFLALLAFALGMASLFSMDRLPMPWNYILPACIALASLPFVVRIWEK